MNALFMVPTLAGYMHGCIEAFVKSEPLANATIVAHPNSSHTPYQFPTHPRIEIRYADALGDAGFRKLIADQPDVAYIGGWIDRRYRAVASALRRHGNVVLGMDNRWNGTSKQLFMSAFLGPWVRSLCSHIWIPGISQYDYARRLGFRRNQIITGLYSANTSLFRPSEIPPGNRSPKTLLFTGAMWEAKGVNELVAAFLNVAAAFPEWRLQLVGDGPLVSRYRGKHDRIEVAGFRQQSELAELFSAASAFCLPSHYDQWAVVIHEACCAGLPIVATDACGATNAFVHDDYNGFQCQARNVQSLTDALRALMSLSSDRLNEFGRRSHELSRQITQELWVSKIKGLLTLRAGSI